MTRVIEKKLGRHKAVGMVANVYNPRSAVLIDHRQKPKSYLGTLIHEKIHLMFPDWSETKVRKFERELCNYLWDNGYRKVSQ